MECPVCGARLASCAVRGIKAEPQALVVKLACTVCGESSVAIVERDDENAPAFTEDDVLDAHDFLQTWRGSGRRAHQDRVSAGRGVEKG